MGYVLLWIECLVLGWLLVATAMACLARTNLPRWAMLCSVGVVLFVPLGIFGTILVGVAWMRFDQGIVTGLYAPLLVLFVCFLIGATGLMFWGMRSKNEKLAASHWPLGKCSLALLVSLILLPMTYWNLELAVSQRLASVRVEAGALASAAAPLPLAEKENAAIVYQRVFESWQNSRPWPEVWNDAATAISGTQHNSNEGKAEPKFDYLDPALGEFFSEHAAELSLLRQAAAMPGCRFDRDFGRPSLDMMLPELTELRTAARLLAADARRQAALGQRAKALENVDAMFSIAEHSASEPFLVSVLVGIAIDAMATNTLQEVLPAADNLDEELAAREQQGSLEVVHKGKISAEDLMALSIPSANTFQNRMARALRMEEAMALWLFSELDSENEWVRTLSLANLDGNSSGIFPGFASLYRVFLLGQDMHSYRETMARLENLGSQPYHKMKQNWDDLEKIQTEKRGGVLTSMLMPALSNCIRSSVRGDAQHRVAQVAWAMHAYRVKHGQFPKKLADLVPENLLMLPLDPFDGQPIKLKKTGDRWVVYSIGPDMTDDGGVRLDWETKKGDISFAYRQAE